jgi:hypothetical protein
MRPRIKPCGIALAVFAFAPLPAAAQEMDKAQGHEFAIALVIAKQAEISCTGMHPDSNDLNRLMQAANVTPDDRAWMKEQIASLVPQIQRDVDRLGGPVWCTNVWLAYGPRGLGTLQRAEADQQ